MGVTTLAELLEQRLQASGLGLVEFAVGVLGISHAQLSRYLSGKASPSRRTVRRIAAALGLAAADIEALLPETQGRRREPPTTGIQNAAADDARLVGTVAMAYARGLYTPDELATLRRLAAAVDARATREGRDGDSAGGPRGPAVQG